MMLLYYPSSYRRIRSKTLGFTLIEILVALGLLSTIMVFIAISLKQAADNKKKIQIQLDELGKVRDALDVFRHDCYHIRNDQDLELAILDATRQQARSLIQKSLMSPPGAPNPNQSGTPPSGNPPASGNNPSPQNPAPSPPVSPEQQMLLQQKWAELDQRLALTNMPQRKLYATFFKGSEDKILFFQDLSSAAQSGPQALGPTVKTLYEVSTCPLNTEQQCLIRYQEAAHQISVTQSLEDKKNAVTVLEGVKTFKLRYRGQQQQDWVSLWDNTPTGSIRERIPDLIEVTMGTDRVELVSVCAPHWYQPPQNLLPPPTQAR
jgi:type II secretory pathway pseudopilin PulG